MYDDSQANQLAVSELPGPLDFDVARRLAQVVGEDWLDGLDDDVSGFPPIGDYVIDRELGSGGGGVVYHAVLPGWNDEFAIKLFHLPVGEGRAGRRARRELDLVEGLALPDTPRVYEYGVHDGRVFIVSEHVDGRPLDEYCREHGLGRRERVDVLSRVGRILQTLHDRGVLHRDLKPSNIMVRRGGNPVIIDFGVARLLGDDLADSLTMAGAAIGTVRFMAPEQARGEEATIQSDIYGLGATACYLLTGETPHDLRDATLLEAIHRVGHEPPRDPITIDRDLPGGLADIVRRAIAAHPSERFESMAEMSDDLEAWLSVRPLRSQPPSWWRNRLLAVKRHPARWGWGAAACLAVLTAGGVAAAGQIQHIDERLNLLAELEQKQGDIDRHVAELEKRQAFVDRHHEIIREVIPRMMARLRNNEYEQALKDALVITEYERAGYFEDDDPLVTAFEQSRGELIVRVLEAAYPAEGSKAPPSEVAMNAVRAVYEQNGTWDEEIGAMIEIILIGLE